MSIESITALAISVASLINLLVNYYLAKKRIPSEVDKQKAEAAESFSEGAESTLNAAKISNDLLLQRITELKKERRDRDNYIAVLKKVLIDHRLAIPEFAPVDTDPKIKL